MNRAQIGRSRFDLVSGKFIALKEIVRATYRCTTPCFWLKQRDVCKQLIISDKQFRSSIYLTSRRYRIWKRYSEIRTFLSLRSARLIENMRYVIFIICLYALDRIHLTSIHMLSELQYILDIFGFIDTYKLHGVNALEVITISHNDNNEVDSLYGSIWKVNEEFLLSYILIVDIL